MSYVGANLTVAARPITVTADAQSRLYGDANPALTYQVGGSGLANGDALSGGLATSATVASDVGTCDRPRQPRRIDQLRGALRRSEPYRRRA